MANPILDELCERDQETLEAWLVTFGQTWHDDALAVWAADRLPAAGNPLRRAALAEMVKIDLEHQWQRGRRVQVESYLDRFPELGLAESIGADLLLAEFQVRQQFGAPADLADFARRFPAQAADLKRLVDEHPSLDPLSFERPPVAAAERDTSHASLVSDTISVGGQVRELTGTFGRYQIIRKLGQGGMGAVYLAHDTQLDRQVALKIPHFSPQDGPQMIERFLREARAAATLQHPNLCPVYDVGEIGGVHYMTMAYLEGHLLSEYIQPGKPQPERQAASLIRKLALALQEAHTHGIVHRDLKPTNIFVNRRGEPIIMDFGLARRTTSRDTGLTQDGALLGTPAYMAPEQARGKAETIGTPCDIYGLGVILYELLTARRPFRGDLLEVLSQVLTADPEPPTKHRPALDPRLEAICLKAMAKRPADRYATMADFAAALLDFLKVRQAFQPDPAHPAPTHPRTSDVPDLEESYGLTQAAAGLSQLLAGRAPAPPAESPAKPAPASTVDPRAGRGSATAGARAGRGSPDPAPTADRQVSRTAPRAAGQARKPDVLAADESYVIPTSAFPEERPSPQMPATAPAAQPTTSRTRRWPPIVWLAAALAASCAALFFGVVFYVVTNSGTVKIELSDPQTQVQLAVDGDTIDITGLDRPLRLRAGDHHLTVTSDDFETVTQSFTVKRGSEEPLRVTLIPKPAVYTIHVEPADAQLTVSGEGATVSGQGPTRTVTVASPNGQKKIVLLARLPGYQDQERELQPSPGETYRDAFRLQPLPKPTTVATSPPPAPTPALTSKPAIPAPTPPVATTGPLPTITNSIGMKLALIPAGEFPMGSPDSDAAGDWEKPQHLVRITQPFYLGVYEVTQAEYEKVMGENPSSFRQAGSTAPVEYVSWEDAVEFCRKLSTLPEEQAAGRRYRLPTEAEWEYACRAGTIVPFGAAGSEAGLAAYAWNRDNSALTTHLVGQKQPNPWGLYDMHGNVREWCDDCYDAGFYSQLKNEPAVDPNNQIAASARALRGGGWDDDGWNCRPAIRHSLGLDSRSRRNGFRAALDPSKPSGGVTPARATEPTSPVAPAAKRTESAPKPAVAPASPLPTITNSIGMKLALIPAGEFLMGSPESDSQASPAEKPQHIVRITKPFYLGVYEVTQAEYEKVMGQNPSHFNNVGAAAPVENVSWYDAVEFCRRLSALPEEQAASRRSRLPTEAEWEYACRARTTAPYGDAGSAAGLSAYAWYDDHSGSTTHPVGQKQPNAWGLYDMQGNVWEWCDDWLDAGFYSQSRNEPAVDPNNQTAASSRVLRGGGWYDFGRECRPTNRSWREPDDSTSYIGFRLALDGSERANPELEAKE